MYKFNPSYQINDVFNYVKFYSVPRYSRFSGNFEKDLYRKTLKKALDQGVSTTDWPYYEIEEDFYVLNSYGYRTDEFDTFVDSNFDMIIGCSFAEGIGVRKSEMWVSHYEKLLNTRTVNLSKGGNSNKNIKNTLFSWFMSNRPKPRRVLLCWTEATRDTYVRTGGSPVHLNHKWRIDNHFDNTDTIIDELFEVRLKSDTIWSNDFIEDFSAANTLCNSLGIQVYNLPTSLSWTVDDVSKINTYTGIKCNIINYEINDGWEIKQDGETRFFPAADGSHYGPQHQTFIANQTKNIILYEKN
jgi:hypothetical protein